MLGLAEVGFISPIQSGANHMIVASGLVRLIPNFIFVVMLLVVVFLGMAADLGGCSGLDEMRNHIPFTFVKSISWIEGSVP